MNTVFIGGSRRVGRLNDVIRAKLESIVERGLHVVVGDANGSDRAVQSFFAEKRYRDVVVYCMEKACRNNVGEWPVRSVEAGGETWIRVLCAEGRRDGSRCRLRPHDLGRKKQGHSAQRPKTGRVR